MVGKVDRYTVFDWNQIDHGGDPLSLVLNRRMRVYVKVDRTRYIARTKSKMAFVMDYTHSLRRAMARRHGRPDIDSVGPSTPRDFGLSWDGDVYLLALDYASIREVWATGDCTVAKFESGGLRLAQADNGNTMGVDGAQDLCAMHEEVRFGECYLVEKTRLTESPGGARSESWQSLRDRMAASLCVRREDLYLETAAITLLQRQGKSAWPGVSYPLEKSATPLPDAIYWLYQAAVAFNRDKAMEPGGIKDWLRENASGGLFRKRWVRTAVSIVPADGGLSKRIEKTSGRTMEAAAAIPSEHVGSALRLVLAMTDWWQSKLAEGRWPRDELAGKLEDAGFKETAIIDLAGMITGEPLGDDEAEKMKEYLGTRNS